MGARIKLYVAEAFAEVVHARSAILFSVFSGIRLMSAIVHQNANSQLCPFRAVTLCLYSTKLHHERRWETLGRVDDDDDADAGGANDDNMATIGFYGMVAIVTPPSPIRAVWTTVAGGRECGPSSKTFHHNE